ncbi:DMSO/selenate family reductase complex A subunit [uncultured Oscillibacter sp.]|uniref:DMSO/selenate family reductase complex A subunit n=1 Tax=uncultured Oscillibacter sp. TaxID=876091 RepID=UPI00280C2C83|nr:DMSO/selenate family reductase complex A subunit [uncultured Oscillibacter sp.]
MRDRDHRQVKHMDQQNETKIIHTMGRNNCGGRCIIHAHVRDGQIEKLTTDTPQAAGDDVPLCACIRGLNYHKTFLGPDRLRYPMKRVGERGEGKFQRISWEEATDLIAREWVRIRDTYGPGSRYVNYATGISAAISGSSLAKRLLKLDGGYLGYYNSYSTACIRKATDLMYGTCETGNSLIDWLSSNLIILWGHNPAETKFDSQTMYYLRRARKKGIPIIVVDPRRNDTAEQLGAEWIPLRPATDAALQDAMAYVIVEEGLQDQEFLDRCCLGFDKAHMPEGVDPSECVLSYLTGEKDGVAKTPEWAEAITGVPAETIRSLAIRYATARPAALVQGFGAQRHAYGEQGARGGILLACMTGNVGVSGGWASGSGLCTQHPWVDMPDVPNPYPMEIPTYLWTEAVVRGHELTALDGVTGGEQLQSDIKMILNLAGNCLINQHGDINRTAEILRDTSKCEFIVCSDLFMTASAKFADVLLPGVSMFEGENITQPWQYGDFVGFNNQVIEPLYEGRFEYDWLSEVAEKIGLGPQFTEGRTLGQWLEWCYEDLRRKEPELPDYETFKKAGIWRYQNTPVRIAFADQRRDIDHHPFPTPSGKVELFSPKIYHTQFRDFMPAIPRYVDPPEGPNDPLRERYPLQLIGWHTKRRCHSIHDNNQAMHAIDPQALWMHPKDAQERGITEGQQVLIWNDRGRVQIGAHLTDRIMPGVVALSQGAWYAPDKNGTDHGGCINVLTSLRPTPYARGNGQHTNLVEVRPAEER